MAKNNPFQKTIDVQNRRAGFEYFFEEKFEAGIMLTGTEIKSIRLNRFNMQDSFCYFQGNELYVKSLHISPYEQGTYNNHDPLRERKLLLHKKQLSRLLEKLKDQGKTIVVTRLYINEEGRAKLEIALAKGKKLYDKREGIKERDIKRDIKREISREE